MSSAMTKRSEDNAVLRLTFRGRIPRVYFVAEKKDQYLCIRKMETNMKETLLSWSQLEQKILAVDEVEWVDQRLQEIRRP